MKLDVFEPYDIVLSGESRCRSDNDYDDSNNGYNIEPSYTKYGGYNGWDDDTIDSAFEGMPEATWNID